MQRRRAQNINFWFYFFLFLGIALALLLPVIFRRQSDSKPNLNKSACLDYFNNRTYYNNHTPVRTTIIRELHGSYEKYAADCLDSIALKDDHLLIEAPGNGQEIPCDAVHSEYKRFNGKLKCYAADVPIDDNRRLYSDYAFRANFIAKRSGDFFKDATNNDVIIRLSDFGNYLRSSDMPSDLQQTDKGFLNRNGKYIIRLAEKMRGMNITQMKTFLKEENKRMVEKSKHYEALSRSGPTNDELVKQIKHHQHLLSGSKLSLFAVTGADHGDAKINTKLNEILYGNESVMVLTPKTWQ